MALQTRSALSEPTLLEGSVRVVQTKQGPALVQGANRARQIQFDLGRCTVYLAERSQEAQPMIYSSAEQWQNAPHKRVVLFGMSGLGKTYMSNTLRDTGSWFHYSVDYRIGTHYMGDYITDSIKRKAMDVPYLRELLLSDSIYLASNITFENLAPLSTYMGKPGAEANGGVPFQEYRKRQEQHRRSEIAALLDTPEFIGRAEDIYQYDHFICDCSGSICEVVDPFDRDDPVLKSLSETALLVWIKGNAAHTQELVKRFDKAPKPMYYHPDFLVKKWTQYLADQTLQEHQVNPDSFIRWIYAEALAHRQPRYEAMANWGVTVDASEVAHAKSEEDFSALIGQALAAKVAP